MFRPSPAAAPAITTLKTSGVPLGMVARPRWRDSPRTGGGAAEVAVNPQGLAPRNEGLDGHRTAPHTSPDVGRQRPINPVSCGARGKPDPMVLPAPTLGSAIVIGLLPRLRFVCLVGHLFGPCLFGVGLFVVGLAFGR